MSPALTLCWSDPKRLRRLLLLCLALMGLVVFWPSLRGDLLYWDDDVNIFENPHIRTLDGQSLRWMFTDFQYARRYLPLAWLGWALHYQGLGSQPFSFHLGNLLLHILNAGLVFLLIDRLLALGRQGDQGSRSVCLLCAFLGAWVWMVHPLAVETVAWASGRIYGQATFFLLLALLAYLEQAVRRQEQRLARGWLWFSVAAYAASLLTYPIALMALAVMVIVDVYPLRRLDLRRRRWGGLAERSWWLEKLPFLAVTILVCAVTLWARFDSGIYQKPAPLSEFGLVSRAMQACYVWIYYLWRFWWPVGLSPVYSALISFKPFDWPFLLSLVGLVAGTVVLVWKRRAWPALLAGWLAYLALLMPFLGLTEHPHFTSDRYSYLPGIAGAVLLAAVLGQLGQWRRLPPVALGLVVCLTGTFSVFSARQIACWRDTVTLHEHMIETLGDHPYRARLLLALGVVQQKGGEPASAQHCFEQVLQIQPDNADAHSNLADLLTDRKEFAAACRHYEEALRHVPNHRNARQNFGIALAIQGDLDGAARQFRLLLRDHPGNVQAHHNLSLTLAQLGQKEDAEHHRREADRLRALPPQPN